ncbi:MAG: dephospho-CoA kinase [Cytophagales bacterium]|nr:dephospho-CoA kinase [Cytophagales bacterium]
MLKVGITGGIGSGKTTVTNIFARLGVPVYNSDDRAKWLQENDEKLIQHTVQLFGNESYIDNKLNKAFIAGIIFTDAAMRDRYNALVHPVVFQDFANWINLHSISVPYVLKESALLMETNGHALVDKTILVVSDESTKIKRILRRDTQRTEKQIIEIMNNQMKDEHKIPLADYIIHNNENDQILSQVLKIHEILINITLNT